MVTTARTFIDMIQHDPANRLEMLQGRIKEKPEMAYVHNDLLEYCHLLLRDRLDWNDFRIRTSYGRVTRASASYFIPDLMVIPTHLTEQLEMSPKSVEIYDQPLPLVVEIWSPSTGDFDKTIKLEEYQRRGDAEIWLLNADDESLRSVVRQPDGTYHERTYHAGDTVTPAALPAVSIDVGQLFRRGRPAR